METLLSECWQTDPSDRPTALEVLSRLSNASFPCHLRTLPTIQQRVLPHVCLAWVPEHQVGLPVTELMKRCLYATKLFLSYMHACTPTRTHFFVFIIAHTYFLLSSHAHNTNMHARAHTRAQARTCHNCPYTHTCHCAKTSISVVQNAKIVTNCIHANNLIIIAWYNIMPFYIHCTHK